jgi:release factor glutamine methyltransferase
LQVLDFGTGSGCLAITLAVKCLAAQIYAIDSSAGALALARENAASHSVKDRIGFFEGDGFAALPAGQRVDLIVANPPYIPSGELSTLQPEVRDYEPRRALDGGPDGLDYYRRLSLEAPPFLTSRGKIMLEIGDGQSEPVRGIFEEQKWIVETIIADYTQRPRIVIAYIAGSSPNAMV